MQNKEPASGYLVTVKAERFGRGCDFREQPDGILEAVISVKALFPPEKTQIWR